MFDLICGTSIGAAIAMCLALGASIEDGYGVLRQMANRVMAKSSNFRLLTTGSKISAEVLDPMVRDTVRVCGADPNAAAPPPGGGVPHFFMTTCCMDKNGSWSAFVNSNYARHAHGRPLQLNGSDSWSLFARMRSAVAVSLPQPCA
eukprot:470974-Pleurochrysis_carterae.AAC.1